VAPADDDRAGFALLLFGHGARVITRRESRGIVTIDRRTIVFLSHADEASVRLAGSCALTAAAMGGRVDVFLLGEAVRAVVEAAGERDEGPARALFQARGAGNCRLLACSAGLVESGIDPAAAQEALDAVVGWPTILEWTRGVPDRFFF
jgi:predicted peroxiredoxin